MKTYYKSGYQSTITESAINVFQHTFPLNEIESIRYNTCYPKETYSKECDQRKKAFCIWLVVTIIACASLAFTSINPEWGLLLGIVALYQFFKCAQAGHKSDLSRHEEHKVYFCLKSKKERHFTTVCSKLEAEYILDAFARAKQGKEPNIDLGTLELRKHQERVLNIHTRSDFYSDYPVKK